MREVERQSEPVMLSVGEISNHAQPISFDRFCIPCCQVIVFVHVAFCLAKAIIVLALLKWVSVAGISLRLVFVKGAWKGWLTAIGATLAALGAAFTSFFGNATTAEGCETGLSR